MNNEVRSVPYVLTEHQRVLRHAFERWAKRQKVLRLDLSRMDATRYWSDVTTLAFTAYKAGRRAT